MGDVPPVGSRVQPQRNTTVEEVRKPLPQSDHSEVVVDVSQGAAFLAVCVSVCFTGQDSQVENRQWGPNIPSALRLCLTAEAEHTGQKSSWHFQLHCFIVVGITLLCCSTAADSKMNASLPHISSRYRPLSILTLSDANLALLG